jgi:hypothetical protein
MNDPMGIRPVSVPVRIKTTDFNLMEVEVIIVECPRCFAIVRESRLDAHMAASHA